MALTVGQLVELLKGFPPEWPAMVHIDAYRGVEKVDVVYPSLAYGGPDIPIAVAISAKP